MKVLSIAGAVLTAAVVGGPLPFVAGAQGGVTGTSLARDAATKSSDTSLFAPLTLPTNLGGARPANGAPARGYWQNRADYDLRATLDTGRGSVQGAMTLRYTNNSPKTLDVIWFQLEQNRFRGTTPEPGDNPRLRRWGPQYGYTIHSLTQQVGAHFVPVTIDVQGAIGKVTLAEPLKPGHTTTLQITWDFIVPPSGNRMGRTGTLYAIAQWYPRVCVYDDVKGWNTEPYRGREFYLEYGDFTLQVTIPASYVVAATGTLTDPRDVLTPTEITRLAQAVHSDTVVHVITADELRSGAARPIREGTLTWKFQAKNVRDMVWCASPEYLWDATGWKGILAQAYYPQSVAATWEEAADMGRMSIQEYSERWYPYPYPQVSVVETLENGMEYPMLTMIRPTPDKPSLYGVVTHEVGHNWLPMLVGSNERLHAWQDEGFNQYINTFSEARRYPQASQFQRAVEYVQWIERISRAGKDVPLMAPADDIPADKYGAQYAKTAGILHLLREEVLGPDVFDAAFRIYIRRWAYKHPTPADFFRTMTDVSKQNLDWFWREWWFEAPRFDQAIGTVTQVSSGDTARVTVTYANVARGVLPIRARFTFSDGSTQDVRYPAEVWRNGTSYTQSYSFIGKTVRRIVLDPDQRLVDVDRKNNEWTAPSATSTAK